MVYKYDEIIAVLQTEGEILQDKKEELKSQRYNHRYNGIYREKNLPDKSSEIQQSRVLDKMTPEEFEQKRLEQAMQLHYAYKSNNIMRSVVPGKNYATRDKLSKTSTISVRQVTGKYAERDIYNTDILYLDQKTILGIEAVAWAETQVGDKRLEIKGISPVQLLDVVDDLVATQEILEKDYTQKGKKAPSMKVLATETNLLKRSIGFHQGENVYGIEDYSVNVKQMLSNKTNIFKKTYRFFKEKWKDFNKDPNQPVTPSRFGDEEIYLDDEERG